MLNPKIKAGHWSVPYEYLFITAKERESPIALTRVENPLPHACGQTRMKTQQTRHKSRNGRATKPIVNSQKDLNSITFDEGGWKSTRFNVSVRTTELQSHKREWELWQSDSFIPFNISAIWETFFGPILQERRFELRDRVILFNLLRPFENVSLVVFYGKTFQEATPMNGKASWKKMAHFYESLPFTIRLNLP